MYIDLYSLLCYADLAKSLHKLLCLHTYIVLVSLLPVCQQCQLKESSNILNRGYWGLSVLGISAGFGSIYMNIIGCSYK